MTRRGIPLFLFLSAGLAVPAASAAVDFAAKGSELFESGKLSKAALAFEDAARVSTAAAEAYLDAAIVYRDLGDNKRALGMFEKAVAVSSSDADVQAEYGWAALRAGRLVEANSAFDAALDIRPDDPEALLGRGRLLLEVKRPDEASKTFEGLVKDDPDHTLGWLYLARAYEQAGRAQDAVDAYQRSFQSDSAFSEVRLSLGSLYQHLKNFNEAWRQYAMILTVDPRHLTAQRLKRDMTRRLHGRVARSILPVQTISGPSPIVISTPNVHMPVLRVGVATSESGRPILKSSIAFRCTGPFRVVEPATGKVLKEGPGDVRFLIRAQRGGGMFEVVDARHRRLLQFAHKVGFEPKNPRRDSIVVRELRVAQGYSWSSTRDRQLKGRVEVRVRGRRLYLVDRIGLEDYIYGVVTEEMPRSFPLEALKAQAVIARSMTLFEMRHLKPHKSFGYDMCDGQHCQVYGGVSGESPEARAAVDETRGQVLTFGDDVAQTPYSSNCGGHTQDSGEVHGWAKLRYLKGRLDGEGPDGAPFSPWRLELWLKRRPSDVYCDLVPDMPAARFRWIRAVPAKELAARINREHRIGDLKRLVVVKRSRAGHANEILLEGTKGRVLIKKEHVIRRTLGLGALRSTLFVVETERDSKGMPTEFVFYGGGWGHGVGLCQYGAAGRALRGQDYRVILDHYFPGTKLRTLDY